MRPLEAGLAGLLITWTQLWAAVEAQVLLSEVMADPAGSESHDEFVELHNPSADQVVDLSAWRLGDGDELDRIVDAGQGTRLLPGGFAVVVDGSYAGHSNAYDSVRVWAIIVTIDDNAFGRGGWSNSEPERVLLFHPEGDTADGFSYDPAAGTLGHSWERAAGSGSAWSPSLLPGGTPGLPNSVDQTPAPQGVVEVEVSPDPFTERLDILCRVPEAPARLEVTVFDAEGVRVVRLMDWEPVPRESRLVWDGLDAGGRQVAPGLYVILVRSSASGRVAQRKTVVARR